MTQHRAWGLCGPGLDPAYALRRLWRHEKEHADHTRYLDLVWCLPAAPPYKPWLDWIPYPVCSGRVFGGMSTTRPPAQPFGEASIDRDHSTLRALSQGLGVEQPPEFYLLWTGWFLSLRHPRRGSSVGFPRRTCSPWGWERAWAVLFEWLLAVDGDKHRLGNHASERQAERSRCLLPSCRAPRSAGALGR